jgi:hypothetical protein
LKLRPYTLEVLAGMVVGDHEHFPYRSSSYITSFFTRCDLPFVHDGSTRKWWANNVLEQLNDYPARSADLPSDALLRVIAELFEEEDFLRKELVRDVALEDLNKVLKREGLLAYLDDLGRCFVRNTGSGNNSASVPNMPRPLSKEEIAAREKVAAFLDSASEDDFTEKLLVPFFQRLGFYRVSAAGHKEKTLEFGKDLWMKYQLPTGHWLYFCAQIKRDKIDASGAGGSNNAANVLTQVKMAIDHPLFDPDLGRKVLLDHVFVITAGEITRAARTWIVEHLDASQRRHIIFMDRTEFLDQSAKILPDLQLEQQPAAITLDDDLPF